MTDGKVDYPIPSWEAVKECANSCYEEWARVCSNTVLDADIVTLSRPLRNLILPRLHNLAEEVRSRLGGADTEYHPFAWVDAILNGHLPYLIAMRYGGKQQFIVIGFAHKPPSHGMYIAPCRGGSRLNIFSYKPVRFMVSQEMFTDIPLHDIANKIIQQCQES